jgi:hypothetical protein
MTKGNYRDKCIYSAFACIIRNATVIRRRENFTSITRCWLTKSRSFHQNSLLLKEEKFCTPIVQRQPLSFHRSFAWSSTDGTAFFSNSSFRNFLPRFWKLQVGKISKWSSTSKGSVSATEEDNPDVGNTAPSSVLLRDHLDKNGERSPSFKVSRITYTGTMYVLLYSMKCNDFSVDHFSDSVSFCSSFFNKSETVNLDTATLLKEASIYARDLFFTLNLTSRQERYKQRGSSNNQTDTVRRNVSAIQSRKKKTILLSFGSIRAVAGLQDVLLFDAHLPAVREFALELRNIFLHQQLLSSNCNGTVESISNSIEPYELLFLETVLRDTVDSYHRRLRLFEPIGKSHKVQFKTAFPLRTTQHPFFHMCFQLRDSGLYSGQSR